MNGQEAWEIVFDESWGGGVNVQALFNGSHILHRTGAVYNIELSHWYKVDKVFYTPEASSDAEVCKNYIIHNEA